jgi:hypothetical protein
VWYHIKEIRTELGGIRERGRLTWDLAVEFHKLLLASYKFKAHSLPRCPADIASKECSGIHESQKGTHGGFLVFEYFLD